MNLIRGAPQSHFDVLCPAVFCRIVKGLLQDSEKAKRNVRWHGAGQILALEVNPHLRLLPELFAEASHDGSYAQIFQFCRVQLVRQGLDIGCDLGGLLLQFSDTVPDFKQVERALLELCQVDSQQCNTLTDVVMKLSGDP